MTVHHSADARTALLATYIARYANPRAGMRITSRHKSRGEGKGGPSHQNIGRFGARGRTIYNADKPAMEKERCAVLRELARIDAEEATRKREINWEEEEDARSSETGSETGPVSEEEMFALYTHIY